MSLVQTSRMLYFILFENNKSETPHKWVIYIYMCVCVYITNGAHLNIGFCLIHGYLIKITFSWILLKHAETLSNKNIYLIQQSLYRRTMESK